MKTPIDHYIDDALDDAEGMQAGGQIWTNDGWAPAEETYSASRDVDESSGDSLTKDFGFRRRSFGMDPEAPKTDGQVQIGTDGIEVELVQGINEDDFKRVCGLAINSVAGRQYAESDWSELLRGGLQTGLESQVIVFGVSGVSRACTHQLVRTRKAAYHQQSQRSSYYGPHPEVRLAESVWRNPEARAAALRAIYFAHQAYEAAVAEDISYQDARLILPEGTTNWIMCEYPLRTWLDTFAYRGCSMFQWEIVTVFRKMRALLVEAHPWLEPYAKISCEKTAGALDNTAVNKFTEDQPELAHACTYQGHERVEGQCDFPWARESNRTFVPDHFIERQEA